MGEVMMVTTPMTIIHCRAYVCSMPDTSTSGSALLGELEWRGLLHQRGRWLRRDGHAPDERHVEPGFGQDRGHLVAADRRSGHRGAERLGRDEQDAGHRAGGGADGVGGGHRGARIGEAGIRTVPDALEELAAVPRGSRPTRSR